MADAFGVEEGPDALAAIAREWDALALPAGSPFLLTAWLEPFCRSLPGPVAVATLRDPSGGLLAAGVFERTPGGLASAADDHSGDWDLIARDPRSRRMLWDALVRSGIRRLSLRGLRAGGEGERVVGEALRESGWHAVAEEDVRSPYLVLPGDFDTLLDGRSANLRSQWRRRRRALGKQGELTLRVNRGGDGLDADLEAFMAIEASGWKAREGTAIASDDTIRSLYGEFARRLAADGRLRLYLLEVDGRPVAGDLGCVVGDSGFLVKTGYDEGLARLSPGLVLRGEVLRASIEEGLRAYDFLGPSDPYKTRWTDDGRGRLRIHAYRGMAGATMRVWRSAVRPVLKRARGRAVAARRGAAAG